jgi:predicted unusual protein kinase regulating ubiquinone biosynthesis (AarF/ABC1/UbiB family)
MLRTRYARIVFFFAQAVLGIIGWELVLPRLGLRGLARRTRPARLTRLAARFRALAIRMGGVLIKMGQFLSSRLDILPPEITAELSGLQDEVPPEAFDAVRRLAETELGASLAEKFATFETAPLAAASLGQAHRATLQEKVPDGQPAGFRAVVVKIQRPNIEALINTDLAALRVVGSWLHRYPPIRRRADVPALLAEFARSLNEEVDYLAEGRNAETFAANFQRRPGVHVPRVVWTHTTRRVLTLEDVVAIKVTDYDAITAAGIDRQAVAQRLFATYWQQILEDGFFHADPHPGNLFVTPEDVLVRRALTAEGAGGQAQGGWALTFIDFGMVGHVSPKLRAGIRETALAVGTRDAARLIKGYQMLGVLLPNADLDLLEKAEARLFEQFWGKSMSELREMDVEAMRAFAAEFGDLLYSLPFQVPEDLILLGRTAAILSGMCTGLDPEFNFWGSLEPYVQKLVADEALTGWRFWAAEFETLARALVTLPKRADAMLSKMEQGKLEVRTPDLTRQMARIELGLRRATGSILFMALLLGGIQLYLAERMWPAAGLLASAGALLIWLIAARRSK